MKGSSYEPRPSAESLPGALQTRRTDLEFVHIDRSSLAISAEGTNLLGADPALASSTLESDKKIVYPNLEVRTNSQVVTVYDRAFEPGDVGRKFDYKVRTSEGVTTADVTTAGLSGATARPDRIVKGQVATVYVDPGGFAKLPPETRITFKLEPSANARLVSSPVVETTKAALIASSYAVGQVTGLAAGELEVKVEARFPDLKGPEVKNYSIPFSSEKEKQPKLAE